MILFHPMKRYIEHIKNTRTTHERRQHAVQVAGVATLALFAVWLGTLGLRLASPAGVAQTEDNAQTASVVSAVQSDGGAQLQVSTTSVFQ